MPIILCFVILGIFTIQYLFILGGFGSEWMHCGSLLTSLFPLFLLFSAFLLFLLQVFNRRRFLPSRPFLYVTLSIVEGTASKHYRKIAMTIKAMLFIINGVLKSWSMKVDHQWWLGLSINAVVLCFPTKMRIRCGRPLSRPLLILWRNLVLLIKKFETILSDLRATLFGYDHL